MMNIENVVAESGRNPFVYRPVYKNRHESNQTVLKGIEIELFSYLASAGSFDSVINQVCGAHFEFRKVHETGTTVLYYITPMDHCLIEGGMMYTSAGTILSELASNGVLLKGYRTIEN